MRPLDLGSNFPDWADQGLCSQADPDGFFPNKGESTRQIKEVCNGRPATNGSRATDPCPVRAKCLAYALANDERWGVWGGLSELERRRLKKGNGRAA